MRGGRKALSVVKENLFERKVAELTMHRRCYTVRTSQRSESMLIWYFSFTANKRMMPHSLTQDVVSHDEDIQEVFLRSASWSEALRTERMTVLVGSRVTITSTVSAFSLEANTDQGYVQGVIASYLLLLEEPHNVVSEL